MNAIVRRDPLAGMNGMKRFMDRFFDDRFFGIHRYSAPTHQANPMPIDVTADDKQVVIQASLPGVKPDNVNVSVEDNRLTIEGGDPCHRGDRERKVRHPRAPLRRIPQEPDPAPEARRGQYRGPFRKRRTHPHRPPYRRGQAQGQDHRDQDRLAPGPISSPKLTGRLSTCP